MAKERDISVDILKFAAALLIVNSHMGFLYVYGKWLATGGAIGDALFFFCSGYTLFLGRMRRFDNWYKRRIGRIYPAVFAWAIVTAFLFGRHAGMKDTILHGGGWFVTCIMVYYVIIYFIRKFFMNRLWTVFGVCALGCVVLYFLYFSTSEVIYSSTFRLFFFFLFMLLGSIIGRPVGERKFNLRLDLPMLVVSTVAFYGLQYAALRYVSHTWLQLLSIAVLMAVTYYAWRVCNSDVLRRAYQSKRLGFAIKFIGGLCLEMYIVQHALITDKMNFLFPLNILLMLVIVIAVAYLLRCCANVFSQVFAEGDMNWKEVFKLTTY